MPQHEVERSDRVSPAPDRGHVLIIGGRGYVGCVLVYTLLGRGYRVLMDNFSTTTSTWQKAS